MDNNFDWEGNKNSLLEYLLDGDEDSAIALVKAAVTTGVTPVVYFEKCIGPVLAEVGNQFETLEIFLPEMVIAAEIVKKISEEIINPYVARTSDVKTASLGKVLIATVQGDLHDIGKNMVALMLSVNGFDVIDMGTNVSPADIIARAEREQVDIIGMSSLLTTCLPYMKDVYTYLEGKGVRDKYAIIMGGAAPTPEFAADVGADGYGHSAAEAVTLCKKIMQERS